MVTLEPLSILRKGGSTITFGSVTLLLQVYVSEFLQAERVTSFEGIQLENENGGKHFAWGSNTVTTSAQSDS